MPAHQPTVFVAERWIGRGAAGSVWAGRHRPSGRPVALKWLHGRQPWSDLQREARLMARLDHPALLPVFDLVTAVEPRQPAERPCLVMAFAAGGPLDPWRGRLDAAQVRALVAILLDGLAHLGARGLVHQDLKPANLLLCGAPGRWRPVIADFGVGRADQIGPRAGTPGFTAPEVVQGGPIGPWTDLYGLARCVEALHAGPLPSALAGWVARLSHPDPARRPASAAAARALLALPPAPPHLDLPPAGPVEALADSTAWVSTALSDAPAPVQAPMPLRAPPLPASWGVPGPPRPPILWRGLALWRLREPPMVGRVAARDALWATLPAAAERPTLAVVAGEPGLGGSRLARWIAEAAHARAGWRVGQLTPWPFADAPPAIWILDPADTPTAVAEARRVLNAAAPGLLVAVTRPGRVAAVLRAVGHPAAATVQLGPLSEQATVHLVRQRLNLASTLAEQIAAQVQGAPGLALQTVEAVLPRLVDSPTGLDLPTPLAALPVEATRVWAQRIESLWASASADEQASLVALAVGAPLTASAWAARCAAADLPVAEALATRFAEADLLVVAPALRFTSAAVPQAIERLRPAVARRLHRLALTEPPAAGTGALVDRLRHALAGGDGAAVEASIGRLAEAVIDSADLTRLEPLMEAARQVRPAAPALAVLTARVALVLGERAEAQACFARIDLARLPSAALRLVVVETRSMLHLANGELAAAEALIEPLKALAADDALALRARLAHARIATVGRRYAEVPRLLAGALDDAPPDLAVRGEMYLQECLAEAGQTGAAIARIDGLIAALAAAQAPGLAPHVHNLVASTWLRHGDLDAAERHFAIACGIAGDRMPIGAYFHLNLALVDLRRDDAAAALRRIRALTPRFSPWPVRIAQLMDALHLQAAARLGEAAAWPALLDRLDEQLDPSAATDTRDALIAARAHLPPVEGARVDAMVRRLGAARESG